MAESLAHKFGQIIGDLLELGLQPRLEQFAKKNKLYIDKKGERKARSGLKLSWTDIKNNKHDLDFVLEKGGTPDALGEPVAFIEIAWRRYTKHSRNKAQEIQSAILPLAERYKNSMRFIGVILAGEFTKGALDQLKSQGFCVLYFPYKSVVDAFAKYGIDATSDESTTEDEFRAKIASISKFENKALISKKLLSINDHAVKEFLSSLHSAISRIIDKIFILPLFGEQYEISNVVDALTFLKEYEESRAKPVLAKYEIIIRYNTGDKIDGSFQNKIDATKFLTSFL
jgi:hypothetical protein